MHLQELFYGGLRLTVPSINARSVFLSDLHLGWRHSKPTAALDILSKCRPQTVYLVGDTLEGIHRPLDFASPEVKPLLDLLHTLQADGTQIILVPGNHDSELADPAAGARWQTQSHAIHQTLHGQRYLVLHGDVFDFADHTTSKRLQQVGSWIYPRLVRIGDALHRLGIPPKDPNQHWCTYWKLSSQRAQNHIEAFERFMVQLSRHYACDGVICGHIHRPSHQRHGDYEYFNCGDWVEHRSCVIETEFGEMMLIKDVSSWMNDREVA